MNHRQSLKKFIFYFPFILLFLTFLLSLFFILNSNRIEAATETIGLVRQNCTGYSNCFTSLSAWEAAYGGINFGACAAGDLVCADKVAVAQIDGTWTSADTTAVTIDGWTTDATHYIRIYTTTAARHSGKWDDGKYRLVIPDGADNGVVYIREANVRIDGLQLLKTVSAYSAPSGIRISGDETGDIRISNNIIRMVDTSIYTHGGIYYNKSISGSQKVTIWNNIIYDIKNASGNGYGIYAYAWGSHYWYNNTVINCGVGYRKEYTEMTVIVKNNIAQNCTDGFSANGSFNTGSDYNISDLASDAPGANSKNSTTVSFVDSTNKDFHLSSSDTSAKDAGVNLSIDANLTFSDDIDGDTRPVGSAWDIGADEESTPSDTTPPVLSSGSPTGALSSGTTQTTLSVEAADASSPVSCKYSQTPGTVYASMTGTLSTANGTTFTATITGLTNGTSYNYYIRCSDASGNANTADYTISFSISAPVGDTTPPTVSITSPTNGATVSGTITVSANASDNVAVAGVQFKLDATTNLGTEDIISPYSYSLNTATITDGSHTLTAVARDTSNNYATSSIITITVNNTSPPPPDTTAPTIPTGLTATPISSSQINLSWTASTDGVAVTGYNIYRCAGSACAPTVQIATSATNSYSDTGLTASTVYTYAVSAYDAAGNESAKSSSVSATTQAPSDTTIPTISNISGTVAQGQTLTIAGSNMMNDLKTNWDSIFTKQPNSYGFEGTNPALDGYNCVTTVCSSQGVYDTSVKLMGNKSIKFHVQGESSTWQDALTSYNLLYADAPAYRDIWSRFYARWNHISGVWPRGWIKMFYDHTNYYFQPNNKEADEPMPTNMYIKIGPVPYRVPIPSGALQNNRWYEFEVHWKTDISPFVFDVWMDGVQIWNSNPTYQDSLAIIPFGIINTGGTDLNFSLDHWWDGFAVGSSRIYPASVVEIGNSSNYATATKKRQEPVYLSDGSIQIKVDLSGLGSGPYYLWVTNNQQKQSATYNLSGSVIDTTPPTPPTNLIATAISSSQINLSWNASTDDVGVTGYNIYRCTGSTCTPTTQIATSATNSYSDTGLTTSTAYTYAISAYDAAGNESGKSSSVSAITQSPTPQCSDTIDNDSDGKIDFGGANPDPDCSSLTDNNESDTTPPQISSIISTTLASTTARIDWQTNEPGTSQVEYGFTTQYGASSTLDSTLTTSHSVLLSNLSPDNTTYNYRVRSKDSSNNESISTNNTFITSGLTDIIPPASTTNLTANNITQTSVDLVTWTAAGDDGNSGTASSFDIRYSTGELSENTWNNGGVVRATGEPTPKIAGSLMNYTLVGLTPNTTYKVALKTLDEVPNQSLISNIVIFTTLKAETTPTPPPPTPSPGGGGGGGGGDTTPPAQPKNFKTISADKQIILQWKNPPDQDFVRIVIIKKENNLPTSKEDGAIIYEGTNQEFTDINLDNNKTYYYAIYAYDKTSNYSTLNTIAAKPEAGKISIPLERTIELTIPFPNGSLLKTADSDKIYFIVNNKKRWLANPEVFISYGFTPNSQITVQKAILDQYEEEKAIIKPSYSEGTLVRASNDFKVYIIKPPYKRHIFNPAIFNMYKHFNWNSIKEIDQDILNSYLTSDLYRAENDPKVYSLEEIDEVKGQAIKHHLNLTPTQFTNKNYKWEQVFIVNQEERDYYETGGEVTN